VSCEKGRFDIFFNHLFNEVFLFPFSFVIIPLSHVLISILSKMLFNVSFNMHFTSTLFNAFFNMVFFRLWLCNREIHPKCSSTSPSTCTSPAHYSTPFSIWSSSDSGFAIGRFEGSNRPSGPRFICASIAVDNYGAKNG